MNYDLETTVRQRKSIRSYDKRPLSDADKEAILACAKEVCEEAGPFPAEMKIQMLEAKPGTDTERLGTYGIIRGADTFLGVTVKNTETAPEAVGYRFEKLVLAATAMGLGTCWMAGTFDREQFTGLLNVQDDEIFPVISPIGYPKDKGSVVNSVFRKASKSDSRKPWDTMFFDGAFGTPLTKEAAGEYAYALEMLRLAPSAANLQPWRVVMKDGAFHFYREENPKSKYDFDLQRLDVGIGACHFDLAAKERGLEGSFRTLDEAPDTGCPASAKYLFSWV